MRDESVRVEPYAGAHAALRPLFELAEDSPAELDSYLDAGQVLVARQGGEVIGHLQLVERDRPGEVELKNMAVRTDRQGRGIGARLVAAAVASATAAGAVRMHVATAAADVGNLRFYQRQGFRMLAVERDAFGPDTGYGAGLRIDGIELRDRVWLDRELPAVRVLLVSGSTRAGSTNTAALRTAAALAVPGVRATLWDRLVELPQFVPEDDAVPPAVAALRAAVAAADAVVVCTPEYAGTLPGSMKNAFDWLVGSGELYGKPAAWITVAASGRGGGAEATLATVLGYVGAAVVEPACVRLPVGRDRVGADGVIADPALRAALGEQLALLAEHVRSAAGA